MYYFSGAASMSASQPVSTSQSLSLADVVRTIFGASEQIGVLHLRSPRASDLGVAATVFNKSNPAGTFGSAIPVFRTNRATGAGEAMFLAGLRKTDSSHTNIYLSEVSGSNASATIELYNAEGTLSGVLRDQRVGPFGITIVGQQYVPDGTVLARVVNAGPGRLVAYATPVDRSSGDTWAVTDWNRFYGRTGEEAQVIPVAGAAPGRNNTYFKTDLAIVNNGPANSSGLLRYYQQTPTVASFDLAISLSPGQSLLLDDVTLSFSGVSAPTLGHLVILPDAGSHFTATSRTYTTVPGTTKTFGTGVPTLSRASALKSGQTLVFGGIRDSTANTTAASAPATFRTNIGMVETAGESATVRLSLSFFDGRRLAAGGVVASKSYALSPHQFLQLNAIASELLGREVREKSLGEIDNMQVKVEIVSGKGEIVVYATSTDNGTGDTVLRVE
jgi:hypothetical protein